MKFNELISVNGAGVKHATVRQRVVERPRRTGCRASPSVCFLHQEGSRRERGDGKTFDKFRVAKKKCLVS